MKKLYFTLVFLFSGFLALANPGAYYNSLDTTTSCATFKNSLYNLIKNDTHLSYSSIDNSYYRTDSKLSEEGNGRLVLVERYCSENPDGMDYCFFNPDSICSGGSYYCQCFNKEHVIPKAWFNGSNTFSVKEYTDMTYLWPADSYTNGRKSNFPLGYVQTASLPAILNGTKIGTSNTTSNYGYNKSNVFEPIDSFKGDFARAYLYFVVRYQDSLSAWTRNNIAKDVFGSNSYPGLQPWILQLCMQWHQSDPPSAFEEKRNDSVYAIQGNRNPFIDFPSWAEKIFGPNGATESCVNTGIRTQQVMSLTIYPNPVQDILTVALPKVFVSRNTTISIVDMLGREMISQIWSGNHSPTISTTSLEKGIYVLQVKSEEDIAVSTFVKE